MRSQSYFGDRVVVLNDFICQTGWSTLSIFMKGSRLEQQRGLQSIILTSNFYI
jgi:hypothetical protein